MSLAIELKRRLESNDRPIAKRLKLAENVLTYPYFPAINREEIVIQWLCSNLETTSTDHRQLQTIITTLKQCVRSLNFKTFSQTTKDQLFMSFAILLKSELPEYLNNIILECCFNALENPTANSQFQQSPLELFSIYQNILSNISHYQSNITVQDGHIKRTFINLHGFIKNSNKKMMLANHFIDSNLLQIIFKFSTNVQFSTKIFSICQPIIFPPQSSALFKIYLLSLIRGDDLMILFQEKGEALRPIVTVMDMLLKYNSFSTFTKDDLLIFLKYFTNSYKFDDGLIFLFNVILYKCLNIQQEYINVSENVTNLNLPEEIVKEIHLQNLKLLSEINVNINFQMSFIKCKDDAEIKKSFFAFIQHISNYLFKESVLNDLSLSVIKQTFLLDPEILESNLETFLPELMVQKKKKDVLIYYEDILTTILDLMYKMSRGPDFVVKILPNLKLKLEAIDSEQQKLLNKKSKQSQKDDVKNKLLSPEDIFSEQFCDRFGKLGSELMSWQHLDLLKSLISYLNDFCLINLEKGTIYPSIILLCEVICLLLSSLFHNSKMADQNIAENFYKKFDTIFETFGKEILSKFATVIQNFPNETQLHRSFFGVCKSYGHLKLLLWQYQPHFIAHLDEKCIDKDKQHISNVTLLHSYIPSNTWKNIYKMINKSNDEISNNHMNILILQNAIVEIYLKNNEIYIWKDCVNLHIINNFDNILSIVENEELYFNAIFSNLTTSTLNIACNKIVSGICEGNVSDSILKKSFIYSNKNIISTIASECIRNVWFYYNSNKSLKKYPSLYTTSISEEFDIKAFLDGIDNRIEFINALIDCNILEMEYITELEKIFNLLNHIPIHFVTENVQNSAVFCILVLQLNLQKIGKLGKCLKRIKSDCISIIFKIYDSSFKLPNVFDIIPPQSMMQLINTDYFKLTISENKFDGYYMLNQIITGILVNGNLDNLNSFIPLLYNSSCITETEKYSNLVLNNSFQTLSLLYAIFSSFKRTNLNTDIKVAISKHQIVMTDYLTCYFDNMEWNNVNKKPTESMNITINEDEKYAYLNLISTFVAVLSHERFIPNETDTKIFKRLSKAIDFFLKLCLEELSNKDINLHHARGCCIMVNLTLKNYKFFKKSITIDEDDLYSQIWQSSKCFVQTSHYKIGLEWMEVHNMMLDNIKLTYELCGVKFFNAFLVKELLQSSKLMVENIPNTALVIGNTYVIKSLWSCCLNANLKITGKTEARSSAVKQMIRNCFFWLKNMSNIVQLENKMEDDQISDTNILPVKTSVNKNLEIVNVCFEVVAEFVGTKKMILSNNLIDTIIQMPIVINFDLSNNQTFNWDESLDVFCTVFDKCISLLRNLLLFRIELLQDRLPSFLQSYRKLIHTISVKSNSDQISNKNDIEKLVALALNLEKVTQILVKNEKQDVTRIAPYMVADIVSSFQKVSICPPVKFHLQNCAYCLMQLLDNHSTGFLMRNMPDASRIMFQQLYDNYKKYYKYMGTS